MVVGYTSHLSGMVLWVQTMHRSGGLYRCESVGSVEMKKLSGTRERCAT